MPPKVPNVILNNGKLMPALGLGTWKSKPGEVTEAVKDAIDAGYRHLDCALYYLNEEEVGAGIKAKIDEGVVKREELFITSKLWCNLMRPDLVESTIKRSLGYLGLDYLDLYLIHWPTAFKQGDVYTPVGPDGKTIYGDVDYVDTWKAFEELHRKGLAKSIGVSNFNKRQLTRLIQNATIKPVTNQVECHPYLNQKKLTAYCKSLDVIITAYSPLGSPDRPWAKPGDPILVKEPKILEIAAKYKKSSAQVILRYLHQLGVVPVPKSVTKSRIAENIDIFDFELDASDVAVLDTFDCNGRVCQHSEQQYDDFDNPSLNKEASEQAEDVSLDNLPEYLLPPPRKIDRYIKPEIPYLSRRATVSLLCSIGFLIMFGMRETMEICNSNLEAFFNETRISASTLSALESAFFWGYFVSQIPGGLIAAAYPANQLFGAAIGASCLLNSLIPSLYNNPTLLIMVKFMQGLVEGVTYPACLGVMQYWAPPLERSRLVTIAFSGCYLGAMFSMMICGILINNISLMAPFYFYSIVGFIWYVSWIWLVFEKPSLHTCIDPKELIMIEKSLGGSQQHYPNPTLRSTPWTSFFTSLPCYAIIVANFCSSWNLYLMMLFQALYFKEAFMTTTASIAYFSAFSHLLTALVVPAGGIMADILRKKGILNTTQVRKLFNCGGFGLEATFFIAMAYSRTTLQGLIALTLGVAFSGFAISGFNVNHLDIAPRYASILMGLSNGIGTIAGAVVPVAKNYIVQHRTREEWRPLIILSAFIHYGGIIFYALFASGKQQPWADPNAEEERQWNQMDESVAVTKNPGCRASRTSI